MKTINLTEKIKTALIDFENEVVEVLYAYVDADGEEFAEKRDSMKLEEFATADKKKARDIREIVENIIKNRN